ncbi:Spc7-domain-containing protein [Whalleya microplaca]|nr:Spc7-domain-containing protein [Whalleya microplaca]
MSNRADATVPSLRRPRKSTGHSPVRKRMEKENITVDVASSLAGNGGRKKSRSKSMGPGGIDALKPGSGNRRVSLAAPARAPPRSILKPSIPLVPEIPPHKPKGPARNSPPSLAVQGTDKLPNPFQNDDSSSSGTKIALRTEEEQQAAAREREERERAQAEKEINDRREARRKSLANRRVSFAAEATLHTFHEVEYMQDSTTSTDSTRRASSVAAQSTPALANPEASDPPSTPPEQAEDVVPDSPEHQRDLHQKQRRRSSGAPPLSFNNPDDLTLASSIYSSDSEATDGVMEAQEEIGSDSGSDSDADGVSMDLDIDEVTGTSVASAASVRSAFTTDSNDTLDEALRLASRRAETQRIDEEEEVIPSFGWARKPALTQASPTRDQENAYDAPQPKVPEDDDQEETGAMDMDMDMTNAVGGIIKSTTDEPDGDAQDDEMSMDVTRALGGILPQRIKSRNEQPASPAKSIEGSLMDDATMELTTAVGGIRKGVQPEGNLIDFNDDEDMSMELTTVVGGVLAANKGNAAKRRASLGRRRTIMNGDDEATMDMTTGLGRILPAGEENENGGDATMGMDMTMAMGGIIKGPSPAKDRTKAKHLMEQEVDDADVTPVRNSSSKRRLSAAIAGTATSETGSPGLSAFRGNGIRRSIGWRRSATPQGSSPVRTPASNAGSPAKARTPNTQGPSTPTPARKSPPKKKSQSRSPSPKRADPSSSTPKSASKSGPRASIFQQDPSTGISTPQFLLTPQKRQLTGVGVDRPGLGSPKVAAIFDRRGSIGETADDFVPREPSRNVTFADVQVMEDEEDREHEQEEDKENRRKILEREADGDEDNTTTNLKDMISSMTPKKNPLKGRKSLHVGSAKGLLGKRPAELEDDEDEERDGIKRLKGHQSSPVKNVRLHAPPSKEETTGRVTRSSSRGLDETNEITMTPTLTLSPKKASKAASSRTKGHFRDVESDEPTNKLNFDEPHVLTNPDAEVEDNEERIHLQDFLNMTSIRFMELTTTKRRHTQAPTIQKGDTAPEQEDFSLERCVVVGACTVPMLELYQHSCRELKKYISEGRRIVREIEKETLEENPPLFREYMSATPEFKLLMDNQFKNVKTHARLLSKAMWYEWRMKLQDGLKEGLVKIAEGMTDDEQLLRKEQDLLDSTLPKLIKKFESLEKEHENMQSVAQELADCDPEDLQGARSELMDLDSDIQSRTRKIEELRQQLNETESDISDSLQIKKGCMADIEEAEKVREECRGWTSNEISSLKAKCDALEKQHGWAITGISGTTISMTYLREIELVFDIASFQGKSSNSRIDLWYIAANQERHPQPATPEKEFFVQCIRDHIRGLAPAQTKIKDLLNVVSAAWRKGSRTAENVRLLNCTFPTNVTKTSDSSVAVRSSLLLAPLQTKVEISLGLHGQSTRDGVEVSVVPQARVVYGEHFKVDKVAEYLATRIGSRIVAKEEQGEVESWSDVVTELHERLLARGKKEGA